MKKLTLLFFVSLFVCAFMITANAGTYENLYYEIENGEVTITGCTNEIDLNFIIPDKIEGYPVTKIADYAFYYPNTELSFDAYYSDIIIPNTITTIGDFAFYGRCGTVSIPSNVTSIGNYAFGYYSRPWYDYDPETGYENFYLVELMQIEYYYMTLEGVKGSTAEEYAFFNSINFVEIEPEPIFSYEVSNGEATITDCAEYLISFEIPSEVEGYPVTSIGNSAFYYCTALTSITIPNSVTSIGEYAFGYCKNLTSITIPDSVISIGSYAFYNCTSLTEVVIPDSVTYIYWWTFYNCTSLTSVTIPDSVTSIGSVAFENCTSLTSITIPDSVTSIGVDAFSNTGYYNTSLNWENGVLYIGNHLIKVQTSISGSYEVKSGTKTISPFAFCDCDSLTSVTIGDSVTSIGEGAFYNCESLASITIPDSVTNIAGYDSFTGCYNLVIKGYAGSVAETYANNNSIPFVKIIDIDITDYSLLLEGSIGLKFYLDIKGTSEAVAKFVYDNLEYSAEIEEENGKYFAIFYLAPKDMSKEVTLNLSAEGKSDSVTVSISDYVEYINKNSEEYTESLSLINAISDYNTYADAYFNAKTAEDVVLTSQEVSEIEEISSPKLENSKLNGLTFHSTSLILEDTTTIRHYFKIENLDTFNVSSYTIEGGTPLKISGEYAYTDIENIPSHKLGEQKTVKVNDGQNESNITFSVLNYVKLTYKKDDIRLSNLVKSLYRYSLESTKYNS